MAGATPERGAASARTRQPRVLIIGAGFGGLSAVRTLAGTPAQVLIVDRNNYHGFWPLLYQVATAGLDAASIAYPARAILRKYPNTQFLMAEVSGVDFERKLVVKRRAAELLAQSFERRSWRGELPASSRSRRCRISRAACRS